MTALSGRVRLCVGGTFRWEGDLVTVLELHSERLRLRTQSGHHLLVSVDEFIRLHPTPDDVNAPVGQTGAGSYAGLADLDLLAGLDPRMRQQVIHRAEHVREVLTGYKDGFEAVARPGEPAPAYDIFAVPTLKDRVKAKAAELRCTTRNVENHIRRYRIGGTAALVDQRKIRVGSPYGNVDQRWIAEANALLLETVNEATSTKDWFLLQLDLILDRKYGNAEPTLRRPSRTVAYEMLGKLGHGQNTAFSGSAKARRSTHEGPQGSFGRLRAHRPGEYVVLDTTVLDAFAMERVSGRWVRLELTIAMDVCTRAITGVRLTPRSTTSVDAAAVLYDTIVPKPLPATWPDGVGWPAIGLPRNIVVAEDQLDFGDRYGKPRQAATWSGPNRALTTGSTAAATPDRTDTDRNLQASPTVAPETIIVDHGRIYISEHIRGVCKRLGISIQPARIRQGSDKAWIERFFLTVRTQFVQLLPGYKGPDVHSRGKNPEDQAFYFIDEIEAMLREWLAVKYHLQPHAGLVLPEAPGVDLSPVRMFEMTVAAAGYLEIPADPNLVYEFLEVEWRTIQRYGVTINNLTYNGRALDSYRLEASPYGFRGDKWPFHYDRSDVTRVWFRDPATNRWQAVHWEHASAIGQPFSVDMLKFAKQLAASEGLYGDLRFAVTQLLSRWGAAMDLPISQRRAAMRHSVEMREALGPSRDMPLPSFTDEKSEAPLTEPVVTEDGRYISPVSAQPAGSVSPDDLRSDDDETDDAPPVDGTSPNGGAGGCKSSDEDYYGGAFEVFDDADD